MSTALNEERIQLDEELTASAEMYQQARRGLNALQPNEQRLLDSKLQRIDELHNDAQLSHNPGRLQEYHTLCRDVFDDVICKDMDLDDMSATHESVARKAKDIVHSDDKQKEPVSLDR